MIQEMEELDKKLVEVTNEDGDFRDKVCCHT